MGAGQPPYKKVISVGATSKDFTDGELVTLDINEGCNPTVVYDLQAIYTKGLPFDNQEFDEVHAYEVLEHFGSQGNYRGFFSEWREYWRILKPGGLFCGSVPRFPSEWCWGDPGHTRVLIPSCFTVFLSQKQYDAQIGKTPMTDYRSMRMWPKPYDFDPEWIKSEGDRTFFVLKKVGETALAVVK